MGKRTVEHDDRAKLNGRMIRALGRHVGAGDVEHLAYFADLETEIALARQAAVAGLRAQGYSWADIAAGLGVSRQAAWDRYGH